MKKSALLVLWKAGYLSFYSLAFLFCFFFVFQEFKFLKKSGLDYLDSSGILESDTSNACVSKYFLPFSEEGHPFADLEKLSQNPESRNADQQVSRSLCYEKICHFMVSVFHIYILKCT